MKLAASLLSVVPLVMVSSGATALPQAVDAQALDIQLLDVRATTAGRLAASVYLGLNDVSFELEPHSTLGPKARSRSRVGGSGLSTYKGKLVGQPSSRVAATMRNGQLRALVWESGNPEPWWIAPAEELDARMPADLYLVHPSGEWPLDAGIGSCVSDPGDSPDFPGRTRKRAVARSAGPRTGGSSGTFRAEVLCEADYEFVQSAGSAALAMDEMEEAVFFASAIYEFTFDIRLEIVDLIAHASPADPYSQTGGASQILGEFQSQMAALYAPGDWDLAQLFTNRIQMPAGYAYCERICSPSQFLRAVSWVTPKASVAERVRLSAHEFGHTFGAGHCHQNGGNCNSSIDPTGCGIMGQSFSAFGIRFGNQSIAAISGNPDLYDCLDVDVPSGPPPTLSAVSPLTVEALAAGGPGEVLSLVGTDLGSTHQVVVGGSVVTLYGLDVLGDEDVLVETPTPTQLGPSTVQVANAAGWSNSVTITFVETDPARFVVIAKDSFLGVFVDAGGRADANYKLLISDQSTTTSVGGIDVLSAPTFTHLDTFNGLGLGQTAILPVSGAGTYYVQLVTRDATGALYASPVETVEIPF